METKYYVDNNGNYLSYDGTAWREALVTFHKDDTVWKFKLKKGWSKFGRPEDKPNLKEVNKPITIQNVKVIYGRKD